MPRSWPETHLTSGRVVGFKLRQSRGGKDYYVFFVAPDGRRRELGTGCTSLEKARTTARLLIEEAYAPDLGSTDVIGWHVALPRLATRMTAAGLRQSSIAYYEKKIRGVRSHFPDAAGPAEITPAMAVAYADELATVPGRGKRPRSGHTVATTVAALSAVWHKWLVEQLRICPANPWEAVEPMKTDRPAIKTLGDDQVAEFHEWLGFRFGDWELPHVFFRTKALTGCRLTDLCRLESDQLHGGRLHFAADQTKGRKARTVPLPNELTAALASLRGPRWLWESYPSELRRALTSKGWPTHRLKPEFDPARMAGWVLTLFADYHADHPDRPRVTSHLFRKKAFTDAYRAGIPLDDAAVAFACDVGTIKGHYLGVTEQEITDRVFARLRGLGSVAGGGGNEIPTHTKLTG